jgi:hypothetical protein
MKTLSYIRVALWTLSVATATAAWAQSPAPPKILYGTTTPLAPANEFAVAATLPTPESPRAHYVVVTKANDKRTWRCWRGMTQHLRSSRSAGTVLRSIKAW